MKYYVIAGEASGDLHGAHLLRAIQDRDPAAAFRVWGGDLMEAAGGKLVKHYRDLAFMGFVEVVANLPTILGNLRWCKEDIAAWQPDVLVLIDYPGFNLRIAKWAKARGQRVVYYISPQIWAWHSSRVHQIKRSVDRMLVILPFEQAFYERYGMAVDFVGHPLLDVVGDYSAPADFRQRHHLDERPIIALLPGSRRQEISRILPLMLAAAGAYAADYQLVVAAAPGQETNYYQAWLADYPTVVLVQHATYDLLSEAHSALVTSGTATLETALFGVPLIVCYRGGALSYWIARRLVEVPYISLVNLVVDRPLVRELIQHELTEHTLATALAHLLTPNERLRLRDGFADLRAQLGQSGAAARAATIVVAVAEVS